MSTTVATKNVAAGVALVVAIIASFTFAVTAKADAVSDLQAQVQALLAQISSMQGSSSTVTSCTTFTQNLTVGSKGGEVMSVQKFLNSHNAVVATAGAGSVGNETSYFGAATKGAVMKFQAAQGITPVSGYWGPLSRASANSMCTSTTVPPGGTTGGTTSGPLGVSLSSVQPTGTIIAGQASADLAELTFTGSGSVRTLVLQRTGVSTDSTAKNVYLYQGNVRISDSASIVNGLITFNSTNGLFNVSGSTMISVRADIDTVASGNVSSGNTLGVNVMSITPLGGSVMNVNNVVGMQRVITSLANPATLNFTTAGVQNPVAQTINAGTTGFVVFSGPISVGTRSLNLKAITFKYIGSASTDALSNIGLYIDGVKQSAPPVWSNTSGSNRIGFDMTSAPISLTTGGHTLELRADVVGGSNRDFTISIENAGDIVAEDSQVSGFNVGATQGGTNSISNLSAGKITVNQGTLTITLDPAFGSISKVVGGASNVAIASFKFQAYGEDVKIQSLNVTPVLGASASTSPAANGLRNLTLYANGGAIGSSKSTWNQVDGTVNFSLGSSLIIPAGQSVIVQVKADIMSAANVNYTAGSIRADIVASPFQGQTSQATGNTSSVTSNDKTISSTNVTFGNTSGFTSKTVSPNTTSVKIGSFTLQTGSAEGANVTNVAVNLSGTAALTSNLSNLTITGANSPIGQPNTASGNSNNFSLNTLVPANGSQTFDVFADTSTATGTVIVAATATYRGTTSNVSSTTAQITGPTVTMNAGTLALVSLDSSAPIAQYVVGGVTGVNIGPLKATSAGSDIVIKRIKFNVTGTNGISAVTVGGVTKSVVGSTVDVDGLNIPVALGASGALIPVAVNLSGVNAQTGNANQNIGLTTAEVEYIAGSNTTIVTGGVATASTATHKLVGTKPVVTVSGTPGTLTAGQIQIGSVTITADAAGAVRATTTTFTVTSAGGATVTASTTSLKDNGNPVTQFTCSNGAIGAGLSGTVTCTTTNGYDIPAGTSKTFQLFATVGGTLGNSGTSAITSQLVGGSGFQWYDLQGGTGTGTPLDATLIYNFPTNTYSVRN
ncbi:MAG: baaA1 [Candidatus Kaiserbacteria bacterium]|nr:baaA1 [Candidatus Kaiserbacteria bacterium]